MLSRGEKLKFGIAYWVSASAILGTACWTTLSVVDMKKDLSQAERDRSALVQQVKDLGGTPNVGPRGATGTPGRDGRDGDPGQAGTNGRDGSDGTPGTAGTDGADGTPGANGKDGKDGADGRDGVDGAPGPQGPQGPQGEPGPSCPEGYNVTIEYIGLKQAAVCTKAPTLMKGR